MGDSRVLSLDKLLSSSHHFIQEPMFVSYAMTKRQRKDSFWLMLCKTQFRVGTIVLGPVVRQRIVACDGGEGEEGKLRGGRKGGI